MRFAVAVVCALLSLLPFSPLVAAPHSVSSSRQFIVYADDVRLRGGLSDLAEETKRHLLSLLHESDQWKVPILINAELRQANLPDTPAAFLHISQTGGGLKVQLDLTIDKDLAASRLQRELLRAILVEFIYRNVQQQLPPGSSYVEPPNWLVDGILALQLPSDSASLGQILGASSPVERGLADFLGSNEGALDEPAREVRRACSAALVQALVSSPNGSSHLAQYLRDLPNGAVAVLADLQVHFPELTRSKGGLEQAWRGVIARMIASESFLPLDVVATREQLERLLVCELPPAPGKGEPQRFPLEEFPKILRERDGRQALVRCSDALLLFEPRANPIYRGIVVEYQEIATLLTRGKTRSLPERLARVREWRKEVAMRTARIDDYLNWFEATQATSASGLFSHYLRAATSVDRPPSRHDRISVYLDALAAETAD